MEGFRAKILEAYKENLCLKPEQRHLMIGMLLGDGYMRLPGRSHHANLTVEHGEKEKEYLEWKYEQLKEWVLTPPRSVSRIYYKDRSRVLVSWRFSTVTHSKLTYYHKLFYRDRKKKVPEEINRLFTHPLSLAVWLMDDGNRNKEVLFLSTQNFILEEQERLRSCLWENFGVDSTINFHSNGKGRRLYRIRLTRKGTAKACKLVDPYIIPLLKYKLPVIPL
ncbi:MAG: LAGLIDADG endonuclease [Bacteroidales bacterium]|nr:LAGLIDADG endonuclease [Bacteroidales bacterium]